MRAEQTVTEMAEEVLARQAKAIVAQTGQSFESALAAVTSTQAGQQLKELANGEHRHEKAQEWQVSLFAERAERRLMDHGIPADTLSRFAAERHYSWVENYMEWLRGKEERLEYHALLEEELASLRG
jgi:acetyl-CoA acetyltransferase